jgi:hypothetical protein
MEQLNSLEVEMDSKLKTEKNEQVPVSSFVVAAAVAAVVVVLIFVLVHIDADVDEQFYHRYDH